MSQPLPDLEATRTLLLQQFLSLGDFRPGSVSASPRRCGKPSCRCAQPGGEGHPQFRVLHKLKGKSVSESFPTPAAFQQAADQVAEFHRFQQLVAQLISVNEQICSARTVASDSAGWTVEQKKRLLLFIKKSRGKSRRSSR